MGSNTTTKDIFREINDIETRFPVDQWQVNGFCIWPWVRILLYKQFGKLLSANSESTAPKKTFRDRAIDSLIYKIDKARRFLRYDLILKNKRKVNADAEIIFYSSLDSRMSLRGKLYDQHCDPLIEHLHAINVRSLVIEDTRKVSVDTLLRQNDSEVVSFDPIWHEFLKKNGPIENVFKTKEDLPQYDDFIAHLKRNLPQIESAFFYKKSIREDIQRMLVMKECFLDILKKNQRSKACVIICYYHLSGMALTLACKEAGILAIDLQHGSQHHPAYNQWLKVPKNGYEMLPDVFWNWDKEDEDGINEWTEKTNGAHIAITVGYPWLQMWKDKDSDMAKWYNDTLEKMIAPSKVKLLFSLGGTSSPIPEWILDTVNAGPDNWFWCFRPHPRQQEHAPRFLKQFQSKCGNKKGTVQTTLDIPLPSMLQYIDIHITGYSSVILEAEMFGVPSIATEEEAIGIYPKQLQSGTMVIAKNQKELLNAIHTKISKKKQCKHPTQKNVLFGEFTKILHNDLKTIKTINYNEK